MLGTAGEIRCGPNNRFRVFYRPDASTGEVHILAIGVKERGRLFVGGEEFESNKQVASITKISGARLTPTEMGRSVNGSQEQIGKGLEKAVLIKQSPSAGEALVRQGN